MKKNVSLLVSEKMLPKTISLLFFLLLIVPLVNLTFLPSPATFPKMLLAYLLIEMMGALWLILAWKDVRYRPFFRPAGDKNWFSKKENWLAVLFSGYVATTFIAALSAFNRELAFFGTPEWTSGWFMFAHLLLLFFILKATFRESRVWRSFLKINLLVGLVATAYAYWQHFDGETPFSFFSNRAYLGGFLLFIIFQSVLLWRWNVREKIKKGAWWNWLCHFSVLANSALVLFILDIRGATLGLLAGAGAAFALYLVAHKKENVRRVSLKALIALCVIGAGALFFLFSSGKISTLFQRSETVNVRLLLWEIGLRGFADKPLFGYGPENYNVPFEKHFDPQYYTLQNNSGMASEVAVDQPHNKLIEVLATTGIFAFIFYLGLFLALGHLIYRRYLETQDVRLLALFGMFAAYFVQNLFVFDTISTYLQFAAALALAAYLLKESSAEEAEATEDYFAISPFILAAVLALFILTAGFLVWKPVRAGYQIEMAVRQFQGGNLSEAMRQLEAENFDREFYVKRRMIVGMDARIASIFIRNKLRGAEQEELLKKFIALGEKQVAKEPYHYFAIEALNRLYNLAGKNINKEYYAKNIKLQEDALARGLKRLNHYYFMAEAQIGLGEKEKAIESCRKAIALNPDYGYSYFVFGLGYFLMGEDEKGLAELDEAIARNLKNPEIFENYFEHAKKLQNVEKALYASENWRNVDPNNPKAHFALVQSWYVKGDIAKAREALAVISEKLPAYQKDVDKWEQRFQREGL